MGNRGAFGRAVTDAGIALAVADGVITGRVADAKSGRPLSAATVLVQGTELGATTGDDGVYRVARVPAGKHALTVRRIGYASIVRTVTVGDGITASADFALQPSAIDLQQVVVTGTAGNQTRAAQSAVVNTIDASDTTSEAAPMGSAFSLQLPLEEYNANPNLTVGS